MKAFFQIILALCVFLLPGVRTSGAVASSNGPSFHLHIRQAAVLDSEAAATVLTDTGLAEDGFNELPDLLDDSEDEEEGWKGGFSFPAMLALANEAASGDPCFSSAPEGRYMLAGAARCVYLRRLLI